MLNKRMYQYKFSIKITYFIELNRSDVYIKQYQNSLETENFCISIGDERYKPWPRLLKQSVFAILQKICTRQLYYNALFHR